MTLLDKLELLDIEFKEQFMQNTFNIIKLEMNNKIQEKMYKEKLNFIEEYCELICEIRNENLLLKYPEIKLPSYCFYEPYNIINEFIRKKEYPDEIKWLYLYRIINIPHYKNNDEYYSDSYEEEDDNGYDSY
jgi:hypothetical protein